MEASKELSPVEIEKKGEYQYRITGLDFPQRGLCVLLRGDVKAIPSLVKLRGDVKAIPSLVEKICEKKSPHLFFLIGKDGIHCLLNKGGKLVRLPIANQANHSLVTHYSLNFKQSKEYFGYSLVEFFIISNATGYIEDYYQGQQPSQSQWLQKAWKESNAERKILISSYPLISFVEPKGEMRILKGNRKQLKKELGANFNGSQALRFVLQKQGIDPSFVLTSDGTNVSYYSAPELTQIAVSSGSDDILEKRILPDKRIFFAREKGVAIITIPTHPLKKDIECCELATTTGESWSFTTQSNRCLMRSYDDSRAELLRYAVLWACENYGFGTDAIDRLQNTLLKDKEYNLEDERKEEPNEVKYDFNSLLEL